MTDKITSIRCVESTLKKLRKVEVHPRETNEEIILRLIQLKQKEDKKDDIQNRRT